MAEIRTWMERKPKGLLVSDQVVMDLMQDEINELRAALAERVNPMLLEALLLIDPTGKFEYWHSRSGEPIGVQIAAAISAATGEQP